MGVGGGRLWGGWLWTGENNGVRMTGVGKMGVRMIEGEGEGTGGGGGGENDGGGGEDDRVG